MVIEATIIAPLRTKVGENEEKILKLCKLITEKYGGKTSASLFHVTSTLLDSYDYWVEEATLYWYEIDEKIYEVAEEFITFLKQLATEIGMTCTQIICRSG